MYVFKKDDIVSIYSFDSDSIVNLNNVPIMNTAVGENCIIIDTLLTREQVELLDDKTVRIVPNASSLDYVEGVLHAIQIDDAYRPVVSLAKSISLERRMYTRYSIKGSGTIKIDNGTMLPVMLNDISAGGFSFNLSIELVQGFKQVALSYYDEKIKSQITLLGDVVHSKYCSNGTMLYGCKMKVTSEIIDYISVYKR